MNTVTPELLPIPIPDDVARLVERQSLAESLRIAYGILLEIYGSDLEVAIEVNPTTVGDRMFEGVDFVYRTNDEYELRGTRHHQFYQTLRARTPFDHYRRILLDDRLIIR